MDISKSLVYKTFSPTIIEFLSNFSLKFKPRKGHSLLKKTKLPKPLHIFAIYAYPNILLYSSILLIIPDKLFRSLDI